MRYLRLAETDRLESLRKAVEVVRSGGIVLYPTDTIYGLGCDPFSARAVKRLTELKRRVDARAYLVLVREPGDAAGLASRIPEQFYFISQRIWPGPITMIFDKDALEEPFLGSDSIGIRCPRWSFLREFLWLLGAPLISTSANLSGNAPIRDPVEASQHFADGIDLFLDFGMLPHDRPSTILDIRTDPPRIVREGAMLQRVKDAILEWQALKEVPGE